MIWHNKFFCQGQLSLASLVQQLLQGVPAHQLYIIVKAEKAVKTGMFYCKTPEVAIKCRCIVAVRMEFTELPSLYHVFNFQSISVLWGRSFRWISCQNWSQPSFRWYGSTFGATFYNLLQHITRWQSRCKVSDFTMPPFLVDGRSKVYPLKSII